MRVRFLRTVVVDNPSSALRATSSSTAHDSATGVRAGEKSRPLNAGTTSVPHGTRDAQAWQSLEGLPTSLGRCPAVRFDPSATRLCSSFCRRDANSGPGHALRQTSGTRPGRRRSATHRRVPEIALPACAESCEQMLDRLDDAKPERPVDGLAVASCRQNNLCDECLMLRLRGRPLREGRPRRPGTWAGSRRLLQFELDVCAGVRALRVDQAKLMAVRAQRPRRVERDSVPDSFAPEIVERVRPVPGKQTDTSALLGQQGSPGAVVAAADPTENPSCSRAAPLPHPTPPGGSMPVPVGKRVRATTDGASLCVSATDCSPNRPANSRWRRRSAK